MYDPPWWWSVTSAPSIWNVSWLPRMPLMAVPEMKLARMRTRLPPPGSPAAPGVRRASS